MKVKADFELRTVAGEDIIVATGLKNIDFSKLIALNSSAAYLWRKIHSMDHFSVITLAKLLTLRYGIDIETACRDAQAVVDDWIEVGIVEQ